MYAQQQNTASGNHTYNGLCDDIADRIAIAHHPAELTEVLHYAWGKCGETLLTDNELGDIEQAIGERRKVLEALLPDKPSPLRRHMAARAARKREKMFGVGRAVPLDKNAKRRLDTLARALVHPTEKGKHYGRITAKAFSVFEKLLWQFHNAKTGRCFPSYETIAEAVGCHRDTVAEAIKILEAAGLVTWCHRLAKVIIGGVCKVIRTSNAYWFKDPGSKSEIPTGTSSQDYFSLKRTERKRLGEEESERSGVGLPPWGIPDGVYELA